MQSIPSLFGLPPEVTIFGGVFLLMLLLSPLLLSLAGGGTNTRKQRKKLEERLKKSSERKDGAETSAVQSSLRRSEGDSSLPFLSRTVGQWHITNVLRARLARAGMSVTAERYLLNTFLLFCGLVALPTLLGKSPLLFGLLGFIVSLGVPHMVVNFRINRRTKRFLLLFPDAIDLIVRGLRAGLPVTESIKMVSKEIEQPVGDVFKAMTEKMALGVPLERTLYETSQKYGITELDFFVTSIVLQRETGGNLSEILSNLSEALRNRTMMRMKIKAMSSEAKASMYIIGALPFFVTIALNFMSPEYLAPLFEDFRGNIALALAVGMLSTGMFIMTKMTQFEI